MKTSVMKFAAALGVAGALALTATTASFAQSTPNAHRQHPSQAQDGAASYDVYAGSKRIGRDPDPWIRNEILRHYHSGWPDR